MDKEIYQRNLVADVFRTKENKIFKLNKKEVECCACSKSFLYTHQSRNNNYCYSCFGSSFCEIEKRRGKCFLIMKENKDVLVSN